MPYREQKHSASRSHASRVMPNSNDNVAARLAPQRLHPAAFLRRTRLNPESLTPSAVLQLQRAIGNRAVGQLAIQAASPDVIRRTQWKWNGKKWIAYGPQNTPYPLVAGKKKGEVLNDKPIENDPYAEAETLANGTIIDYPALIRVMNGVTLGEEVKPAVWREMRKDLSMAITLQNKSHPEHHSTFSKNQRPEQQIIDWAKVIQGELKEKLAKFFLEWYRIYL